MANGTIIKSINSNNINNGSVYTFSANDSHSLETDIEVDIESIENVLNNRFDDYSYIDANNVRLGSTIVYADMFDTGTDLISGVGINNVTLNTGNGLFNKNKYGSFSNTSQFFSFGSGLNEATIACAVRYTNNGSAIFLYLDDGSEGFYILREFGAFGFVRYSDFDLFGGGDFTISTLQNEDHADDLFGDGEEWKFLIFRYQMNTNYSFRVNGVESEKVFDNDIIDFGGATRAAFGSSDSEFIYCAVWDRYLSDGECDDLWNQGNGTLRMP